MLIYSATAYQRARRAWILSPFRLALFQRLRDQGVALGQIAGSQGYQLGYTVRPLRERQAEDELMWLIQVGVLRREVDGQGITDSYRLAPLGQQLLETEALAQSTGSLGDWLTDRLTRWGLGRH